MKVCTEPGCPTLVTKGRCKTHRAAKEAQRGTRQARGYDKNHDALRANYQWRMDQGIRYNCWRCHTPIDPTNWQLGHDDHDRTRYRGPECVPCNTATAGRNRT